MVGFEDQISGSVYADYDQPHGYSMAQYNQFFSGGYDGIPAYTGTVAHTAPGHPTENLTVYGSLRAYFHQMHGEDMLRFHILNGTDTGTGQPIWIQLNESGHPNTKQWYATNSPAQFWTAAENAASANLTLPADFPLQSAPAATQLANKVLYLYAGAIFTPSGTPLALHPRANTVTWHATYVPGIGARYVMGEREGFGWTDHQADNFAGIGTHAHELGHIFGLAHPDGEWDGTNPHTGQSSTSSSVDFGPANMSGWGTMQSGAHGPAVNPNGYTIAHRACPTPYNPFYRMDLGWNTRHDITTTTFNQRIDPSPTHFYVVPGANGHQYMLDFRTAANFGQYTGWHRFTFSPGLLIWRRAPGATNDNPMVVPADGRSIFDARPMPVGPNPSVPTWQDRLSDPFAAAAQPHGPTVTHATDVTHLRHATVNPNGNTDPGNSRLAFTNIRNNGNHALVDIYVNYWSGPITGTETWSGTVYVGGDVTIQPGATLNVNAGTQVHFLTSDDQNGGNDPNKSELIVHGTLNANAGGITFRSTNTGNPSNADWYGIRVESGGSANISSATLRDGSRCIRTNGAGSIVVQNNTIHNCGTFGIGYYSTSSGNAISGNTLYGNGHGIYLYSSGVPVSHNIIRNNSNRGIWSESASGVSITNNTIHANSSNGIDVVWGNTSVTSTSLTNNGGTGLTSLGVTPGISYTNSYGNGAGHYGGIGDQTGVNGNISSDPGYNGSYQLASTSQLVDAGAPGGNGEPKGNWPDRINIGRWGNTGSATISSSGQGLANGDFEGGLTWWRSVKNSAASGQAWDRVNTAHDTKNGTWYASTCDQTQGGWGGCHNQPFSEADTGIMRSNRFKVTLPFLNFKIAGFDGQQCNKNVNYVRLRRASDDALLFEEKAPCDNTFHNVNWNVGGYTNQWVYVELVDGDNGGGYAWIAADYFRLDLAGTGGPLANGDFEEGNLNSWSVISGGSAWEARNNTMPNKQATWYGTTCNDTWPDGGCKNGASEAETGTLRSNTFEITASTLDFRLSGYNGPGCDRWSNYVRLVNASNGSELRRTYVPCNNTMQDLNWINLPVTSSAYIELVDNDNNWGWAWIAGDYFRLAASKQTAGEILPLTFRLVQNKPNPFNPETTVRYELPNGQPVQLAIFDMLGQRVRTLVEGEQPRGQYEIVWDGRDEVGREVASGVYLYRLATPQFTRSRKMTLLR